MQNGIKPFLKWAGGKTQLLTQINENLPKDIKQKKRYVEPFIGAGAVFLNFIYNQSFEEYIINDVNTKLINLYIVIKENCEKLLEELKILKKEYFSLECLEEKEKFYYKKREEFNEEGSCKIKTAALLIFLNKTCFNGLYRENSKGKFNVPFGKHDFPGIYEEEEIRKISTLLSSKDSSNNDRVKIFNTSFENLQDYIDENTFVYFDPPYRPVTIGGFTAYTKANFNDESQIKLRDFYIEADKKGAKLMLSNSDPKNLDSEDEFFDFLYSKYTIKRVSASRMINRDGKKRGAITELLIINYD